MYLNRQKTKIVTENNIVWWLLGAIIVVVQWLPALETVALLAGIPGLFIYEVFKYKRVFILSREWYMYIVFVMWASLSLFYSLNMDLATTYLLTMLANILVWHVSTICIRKISNLKTLLYPILLFCFFHFAYGQTIKNAAITIHERDIETASGLIGNPNGLGFILWYGVAVASLLLLNSSSKIEKSILVSIMLLFSYGVLNTGSRKSFIAILIFFGIYGLLLLKERKDSVVLLIMLLPLTVILYQIGSDVIVRNTNVGARLTDDMMKAGVDDRSRLIKENWNFFLENPIFGVGLGSVPVLSKVHKMSHNDYLEVLSMGFPAFVFYISIYVSFLFKLIGIIKYKSKYAYLCLAFIVSYLFLGVGRPLFLDLNSIFFYVLFLEILNKVILTNKINRLNASMSNYQFAPVG